MENTCQKIRVSIVEDNHFIRHALESVIGQSHQCEISNVFKSAEEALGYLCDTPPDVVLMDIDLGKISGIEAVKSLKERCPSVQFMMCTVHDEDDKVFEALAAGASGYILKDTKPEDLVLAIIELANGGAPMSSKIARRVVNSFQKKQVEKNGNHLESLSSREYEILELLVKGQLYKEIAGQLEIAQETVRKHVYNIYKKLHVNNRVEAYHKFYGS
jgi:DNA-binding NarL/FixJ family response regulator